MKLAIWGFLLGMTLPGYGQEVWTLRYAPEARYEPHAVGGRSGLYLVSSGTGDLENLVTTRRSTDGTNWTITNLPYADRYLTAGQEVIGIGYQGIWTTTDGIAYNFGYQPPAGNFEVNGIAMGNGCFVVTTASGQILRSASPAGPWLPQVSPADSITGVAFGSGVFLASTERGLIKSSDGITWTVMGIYDPGTLQGFGAGIFFTNSLNCSVDSGATWGFRNNNLPSLNFLVPSNLPGFVGAGHDSQIYTSPDFETWKSFPSGLASVIAKVAFCGNLWLATSSGGRISTAPAVAGAPIAPPALTATPAIEVSWESITGRQYQIQGSSDNVTWDEVGLPMFGNGSVMRFTAPATESRKFFRVEVR